MSLFNRTVTLSGDVAYLRFTLTWPREYRHGEDEAWNRLQNTKPELDIEIQETVKKNLGIEFDVRSIVILRGSIEIVVAIGTVYYAISKYKNFIDSVDLLKSQLRNLIRSHVDPRGVEPMTMIDSMTPGPTLARIEGGLPSVFSDDSTKMILLLYLILSHAALLTLLIWMIVKGAAK